MAANDLTNKVERLEALEERLGVSLQSLSAFVRNQSDDSIILTICGELHSRDGTQLQHDVELIIAVYDSRARITATSSHGVYSDSFFALETFEVVVFLPVEDISKVRVYPKKGG